MLTSPPLVAGAALGTRGSCDGIAVGNSKYKTGEINSACVFLWGWGMWTLDGGPCSGGGAGAGRVAKSDTVKKVYKLYCSTYTHPRTPVDREEHLATESTEIGGGDGSL